MSASDRLAALMPIVIKDDHLHARWLNTFSYLIAKTAFQFETRRLSPDAK